MEQNQEQLRKEAAVKSEEHLKLIPRPWMLSEDDKEAIKANFIDGYLAGAERAAKEKEQIEPVGYLMFTEGMSRPNFLTVEQYKTDEPIYSKPYYEITPLYSHPPTSAPGPSLDRDKLIEEMREAVLKAPGSTEPMTGSDAVEWIMQKCADGALQHFTTKNV